MSALTYSTFPSTAPMVRTLSEPVIPMIQAEPPWNYRLWAASAAAALGLSLYGWSVFQLADSSSGEAIKTSSALLRSASSPSLPEPTPTDPAIRPAKLEASDTTNATFTTVAVSPPIGAEVSAEPAPAQVVSADISNGDISSGDISKAVVKPTKKKKKKRTLAAASSRKAKKASKRWSAQKKQKKAKAPAKSARPAWLSKFAGK